MQDEHCVLNNKTVRLKMLQTTIFSEALGDIAEGTPYGKLPFLLMYEAALTEVAGRDKSRYTARENAIELIRTAVAIGYLSCEEDSEKFKAALRDSGVSNSHDFGVITEALVKEEVMNYDAGDKLEDFDDVFDVDNLDSFLSEDRTIAVITTLRSSEAPIMKWITRSSLVLLIASFFIPFWSPYISIFSIIGLSAGIVLSEWERKWRANKALQASAFNRAST